MNRYPRVGSRRRWRGLRQEGVCWEPREPALPERDALGLAPSLEDPSAKSQILPSLDPNSLSHYIWAAKIALWIWCLEGFRDTKNCSISHRAICKKRAVGGEKWVVENNRVNLKRKKKTTRIKIRAVFLVSKFLKLWILQGVLLSFFSSSRQWHFNSYTCVHMCARRCPCVYLHVCLILQGGVAELRKRSSAGALRGLSLVTVSSPFAPVLRKNTQPVKWLENRWG